VTCFAEKKTMEFFRNVHELFSSFQQLMMVVIPMLLMTAVILFSKKEHRKGVFVLGAIVFCFVCLFAEKGLNVYLDIRSDRHAAMKFKNLLEAAE
jgi:lipopolysaccharide export LptBFGC system permease protein LptF